MRIYNGYNIPELSDLKKKDIVVPMGDTLMVKLSDDLLFDVGIKPTDVYKMTPYEFNNLIYSRATGYIDTIIKN